jgi:hypothetical protein
MGPLHGCRGPDRKKKILQLLGLSFGCLSTRGNLRPMAVKQAAMRMAKSAVRKVAYWAGGFVSRTDRCAMPSLPRQNANGHGAFRKSCARGMKWRAS